MKLIDDVLKNGKEAIMLVPEISLTPQIIDRFKSHFNENISVLSENCNNFKLNKNINFMKNIEQKMIEEKRLLVGYKKIEPKKKIKNICQRWRWA